MLSCQYGEHTEYAPYIEEEISFPAQALDKEKEGKDGIEHEEGLGHIPVYHFQGDRADQEGQGAEQRQKGVQPHLQKQQVHTGKQQKIGDIGGYVEDPELKPKDMA